MYHCYIIQLSSKCPVNRNFLQLNAVSYSSEDSFASYIYGTISEYFGLHLHVVLLILDHIKETLCACLSLQISSLPNDTQIPLPFWKYSHRQCSSWTGVFEFWKKLTLLRLANFRASKKG